MEHGTGPGIELAVRPGGRCSRARPPEGLMAPSRHPADRRAALVGFATTCAATGPTDGVLQLFHSFLFAEVAAGDLADFAAVPDHVLARLPARTPAGAAKRPDAAAARP